MVCKFCRTEVPNTAKYCLECGAHLATDDVQKTPTLSRKGNTIKVAIIAGLAIIIAVIILSFNLFGNSADKNLVGTWVRSSADLYADETITYVFNTNGGVASYTTENKNYVSEKSPFEWYINDNKDLIILWSSTNCTKYAWNTDYTNYSLSTNPYSWCIKGDTVYFSSTAAEGGYYIFNRQGK